MRAQIGHNTAEHLETSEPVVKSAVFALYETHKAAEEAVLELQKSGFDMQKLSIVGIDYQTTEDVVGFYNTGDRMKAWGKMGAFWGGLWGLMFGSALFFVPGVGPLFAAGPLVIWIAGALEGALVVGGMSVVGAGLYSMGIPKDSIIEYETQIKAGKFVVIAHGLPGDVRQTKDTLAGTAHQGIQDYACCG